MNGVPARPGLGRLARAYLELTKPRIVLLVLLTGVPALLIAARGLPAATTALGAILGTALAAASAAAFNHVFDRDIDAVMVRTRNRPLPTGVLRPVHGIVFGCLLAGLSVAVLLAWTNPLAALVGLLSIFYYAVVYTVWLKRATPQNIVIGGGAGATAPLIAWAAVTGRIELPAALLAAIVFFWTPPHFWALALYRRDDYARAGIPMLPVTHGEEETRRQILLYTLGLVPITLAPVGVGAAGAIYAVPALGLGVAFAWLAWRLFRAPETARAVRLFRFSILYLFVLFVALGADASVAGWHNQQGARAAREAAARAVAAARTPVAVSVRAQVEGGAGVTIEPAAAERRVTRGGEGEVGFVVTNPGPTTARLLVVRRVTPGGLDSLVVERPGLAAGPHELAAGESFWAVARFAIDPRLAPGIERVGIDYSVVVLPAD